MAIAVRQLVGIPDLRLGVHAGDGGLDREIRWAHVSELHDPTEWLDSGELLMTSGLGIPAEPDAQRAYVERMAEAGLSGLLISRGMNAPELSAEMTSAADERSLPVLFASYEVPFTAVARGPSPTRTQARSVGASRRPSGSTKRCVWRPVVARVPS